MNTNRPVLVTGATGYVGGRLIPALLQKGYRVRAMARSVEKLACSPWAGHPAAELVKGDVLDAASLMAAASGCEAAYYLVHSMIAQKDRFAEADRTAARNMAAAAEAAGVKRIIYLGGLAEAEHGTLSKHLSSRIEVARILQTGRVPTTDLRTPMILGSGSASFEILRYLVERLPAMTTPRWVRSQNQPIAISNVIGYLVGCLHLLSEMKMPGDALLDIDLVALGGDRCEIQLIALFLPKGLGGILYWNGFLPVHHILFRGMIEAVVRSAGKQLVNGPEQFTPEVKKVCFLPRYR